MHSPYTGPERRKAKRLNATFIVIYKVGHPLQVRMSVGDREVNAIMLNLSQDGVAILTNYNLPVSTLLLLKFILVNESAALAEEGVKPIQISGEVRYNIPGEKGERRLGISFTQISDADRRAIINFVKHTR